MAGRHFLTDDQMARLSEMWSAYQRTVRGSIIADEPPRAQESDDYVVMTPIGGIAARSGTTIYSELCNVYKEVAATGTNKTLTAIAGFQVRVYNLSNVAVNGSRYVVTSLTKGGTRYVVLESCNAEA